MHNFISRLKVAAGGRDPLLHWNPWCCCWFLSIWCLLWLKTRLVLSWFPFCMWVFSVFWRWWASIPLLSALLLPPSNSAHARCCRDAVSFFSILSFLFELGSRSIQFCPQSNSGLLECVFDCYCFVNVQTGVIVFQDLILSRSFQRRSHRTMIYLKSW